MFTLRTLSTIVVGSLSTFVPIVSATAACNSQFQMTTEFKARQENGFRLKCQLQESSASGPRFRGLCQATGDSGATMASDDASGFIESNARFNMTVRWAGGSVGVYTGFIDGNGRILDGRTFDQAHPERWSTWSLENMRLVCKT